MDLFDHTLVKNWTTHSGYMGDSMTIVGIRDKYIEVDSSNAGTIQVIPKDDFEKVWDN